MSHFAASLLLFLLWAAPAASANGPERDNSVSGTVLDARSGQPLAGVVVIAESYGPRGPYEEQRTVTDAEGRYHLPPRVSQFHCLYSLRFEKELYPVHALKDLRYNCYAPFHVEAVKLSSALAGLLSTVFEQPRPYAGPRPVILWGTAIGEQSRMPGYQVWVTASSPSLYREQVVPLDDEGNFRFPPLPPGTYTLRVWGGWFQDHTLEGVVLRPGRTVIVRAVVPENISYEQQLEAQSARGMPQSGWFRSPMAQR
jgi:5-hydroxyisourate hydrolase-like protein (transthyretin family)